MHKLCTSRSCDPGENNELLIKSINFIENLIKLINTNKQYSQSLQSLLFIILINFISNTLQTVLKSDDYL